MNWLFSIYKFFTRGLPNSSDDLKIWKLVENSIATEQNKIVTIFNLEAFDIRLSCQHILISSIFWFFRLDVAKSSTDTQSAWKNSNWAENYLIFEKPCLLILNFDYTVCSKNWIKAYDHLLINLSSSIGDSLFLRSATRFMVLRKRS
jgi:hypothetical protein